MPKFEQFSDAELKKIIKCAKLKQLTKHLSEGKREHALALTRKEKLIIQSNKVNLSLIESVTDTPSYPILILWALIDLTSLGVVALSVFTLIFAAATIAATLVYFLDAYRQLQKEEKKKKSSFELVFLKNMCVEELIKREQERMGLIESDKDSKFRLKPYKDKRKLSRFKKTLGTTVLVSATLFGTYYLGIAATIVAFGATALGTTLLGPVGLGIALLVSISIGAICGYKYYQANRNNDKLKYTYKQLDKNLDRRFNRYKKMERRRLIAEKANVFIITEQQSQADEMKNALHQQAWFDEGPIFDDNQQKRTSEFVRCGNLRHMRPRL